ALITGGTSGIGEAVAELFAREGAQVAITGRNESRGHAVMARTLESGGKTIFLRTDVRKAVECQRAVDETLRSFGRLDILLNKAMAVDHGRQASASTAFAPVTWILRCCRRMRGCAASTGKPIWRVARTSRWGGLGPSTKLRKPCCSWHRTIRRL